MADSNDLGDPLLSTPPGIANPEWGFHLFYHTRRLHESCENRPLGPTIQQLSRILHTPCLGGPLLSRFEHFIQERKYLKNVLPAQSMVSRALLGSPWNSFTAEDPRAWLCGWLKMAKLPTTAVAGPLMTFNTTAAMTVVSSAGCPPKNIPWQS